MEYLGSDKPVNKIQPLVSVVVLTYNHKNYIKECLDSILMQETDFPYEIILGEDDSTDGTREICIEYAEKFPDKIRLFLRNEKDKIYINGKKTGRFNVIECFKDSRGEYIALCEGDDYWLGKTRLKFYHDKIKETKFIALYSDFETNPEYAAQNKIDNQIVDDIIILNENSIGLGSLLKGQLSSLFFNRRGLSKYLSYSHQNKIWAGDGVLFLALLSQGQIGFINTKTNFYRIHAGGASKATKSALFFKHRALEYQMLKAFGVLTKHLDYLTLLCRLEVLELRIQDVGYHLKTLFQIIVIADKKLLKKFIKKCVSGLTLSTKKI